MNNLYNIFQNEKQRNPDMTIFYRDNKTKSLCYRNQDGVFEVNFKYDEESRIEKNTIYFKKSGEKHGSKVCDIEVNSNGYVYSVFTKAAFDLPDRFKVLFDEWRFDRKRILDEQTKGIREKKAEGFRKNKQAEYEM